VAAAGSFSVAHETSRPGYSSLVRDESGRDCFSDETRYPGLFFLVFPGTHAPIRIDRIGILDRIYSDEGVSG